MINDVLQVKKSEDKLAKTTLDLGLESKRADRVLKTVNTLNSRSMSNEVEIEEMVSLRIRHVM